MTKTQPVIPRATLIRVALKAAADAGADDTEIEIVLGRTIAQLRAIAASGSTELPDADETRRVRGALRTWTARGTAAAPATAPAPARAGGTASAHAPATVPLTECITVFVGVDRCGKTFEALPDGSVEKISKLAAGTLNARTEHVPDVKALAAVLRRVMTQPNAGVILNAVRGTQPGSDLLFKSMANLAEDLGVPVGTDNRVAEADRARLVGVHDIHGVPCVARMKENFEPSMWALLDRDVDEFTPTQYDAENLPFDAWLRLVDDELMPGIATCEHVLVPSSSARVARTSGPDAGKPVGGGNGHVFVRLTGDLTRLPIIATQIIPKAQLAGIAWPKPRVSTTTGQQVGESPTTIIDQSTLYVGRLVFDGLPHLLGAGLVHLPADVQIHAGPAYDLDTFPGITDADIAAFNAKSKTKLTRNSSGGVSLHDYTSLTLDTPLDLGGNVKMTVREWEASSRGHTRIQSPFRASTSMAAFIDRNPTRVYDSGANTIYFLANPAPSFAPVSPPAAPQSGELPRAQPFAGPMTEIVNAMLASSAKPREGLAVYAALAGMAGACHGRIRFEGDKGMRLNLYMTILLPTGEGKEGALQVAEEIARAAGAQVTGKPASGSALEGLLRDWEPLLVQIDEAGHLLAAMNAKNAAGFITDLAAVLLQVYSRGNGTYYTRAKAVGAKEEKPGRRVHHPTVSAMMFATPEKYAQAVGVINVEGGDLGRHLYFIDSAPVRQRRVNADFALPPAVLDRARHIAATNTFSVAEPGKPAQSASIDMAREVAIRYAPGVEGVLQATMDRFSDRQAAPAVSTLERMLAARGYENTLRVAGVLAVWDNPSEPELRADHVAWAEVLVVRSIFDVVCFMDEHMHESLVLAHAAKVLRICRRLLAGELKPKAGSPTEMDCLANGKVPRSAALHHSKLDEGQFNKAVAHLVSIGDVALSDFQRPGGRLIVAIELVQNPP